MTWGRNVVICWPIRLESLGTGISSQKAFNNVQATVVKDITLAYLDFTKDRCLKRQLGSVINQKNKPTAFFSGKLTGAKSEDSSQGNQN